MEHVISIITICGIGLALGFFAHIGERIAKKIWPTKKPIITVNNVPAEGYELTE